LITLKEIMKMALELGNLKATPTDSAIHLEGKDIRKVLFCLDAGVSELLLAKKLNFDALIAHHPIGNSAIIEFHEVFKRHVQQLIKAGVPKKEAENAIRTKINALETRNHMRSYRQTIDAAKLLNVPCMNIHTPLDEVGRRIMSNRIKAVTKNNATLNDIVQALRDLPEFQRAATKIKIRVGSASSLAGKTVVSHGAGTNGGYDVAQTYFKHGVNTVIYIHIDPIDLSRLKQEKLGNLIITGHVASDSVGINPFIKKLEKNDIKVTRLGIIEP
jgi:putative NIF3 family GTP cyclohydrolase 1 type 2